MRGATERIRHDGGPVTVESPNGGAVRAIVLWQQYTAELLLTCPDARTAASSPRPCLERNPRVCKGLLEIRPVFGATKARPIHVKHDFSPAFAQFLAGSSLDATSVPLWWSEFLTMRGRRTLDFDLWLPLANEFGVRLAMQHNVPPLMIHASTTTNWGVNHGRHMPGRDDCLADRFPSEAQAQHLTCATGKVLSPHASTDAALPFVSLFVGLLVAADVARAQLPGYPQVPNFALFDWFGALDSIQAWDRKPRPGCVCREQGVVLHHQFNGSTRYRKLFRLE